MTSLIRSLHSKNGKLGELNDGKFFQREKSKSNIQYRNFTACDGEYELLTRFLIDQASDHRRSRARTQDLKKIPLREGGEKRTIKMQL